MRQQSAYWIILLAVFTVSAWGQAPKIGENAPNFSLPYATRDSIAKFPLTLADAAGKSKILLAFYPADWSSGCTKEVCGLRDDIEELSTLGIEVLAISGDYVYSHHAWAKHHDLPFRLLSDHTHQVARAYGSFNEESGFTRRAVFVVDTSLRIRYADPEYSVRDDVDYKALKEAIAGLQ